MPLLDKREQHLARHGVNLHRAAAEPLGSGVARLRRPRRQLVFGDLRLGDRHALEDHLDIEVIADSSLHRPVALPPPGPERDDTEAPDQPPGRLIGGTSPRRENVPPPRKKTGELGQAPSRGYRHA
jgi:hypothetical protein